MCWVCIWMYQGRKWRISLVLLIHEEDPKVSLLFSVLLDEVPLFAKDNIAYFSRKD